MIARSFLSRMSPTAAPPRFTLTTHGSVGLVASCRASRPSPRTRRPLMVLSGDERDRAVPSSASADAEAVSTCRGYWATRRPRGNRRTVGVDADGPTLVPRGVGRHGHSQRCCHRSRRASRDVGRIQSRQQLSARSADEGQEGTLLGVPLLRGPGRRCGATWLSRTRRCHRPNPGGGFVHVSGSLVGMATAVRLWKRGSEEPALLGVRPPPRAPCP